MSQYRYAIIKVPSLIKFPQFFSNAFFWCRIPTRMPHYIYSSCRVRSLDHDSCSDLPWFWWPWHFWRILIRYFVYYLSLGIWFVFLMISLGWLMISEEENHRDTVPLSSYLFKDTYYQHDISVDVRLTEVMFFSFHHCIVTLFSSFPYCTLWSTAHT